MKDFWFQFIIFNESYKIIFYRFLKNKIHVLRCYCIIFKALKTIRSYAAETRVKGHSGSTIVPTEVANKIQKHNFLCIKKKSNKKL